MKHDIHFHPLDYQGALPTGFGNPFCDAPHPVCMLAAQHIAHEVEQHAQWTEELQRRGKMFGTLIVRSGDGEVGFLAAYSGNLVQSNNHPYFVPPIFDATPQDGYFRKCEAQISELNRLIANGVGDVTVLEAQRRSMSASLQQWLHNQYRIVNYKGETALLRDVFARCHDGVAELIAQERGRMIAARRSGKEYTMRRFPRVSSTPPAAAGDCAAPKLLQYAFIHSYAPLAIAEFWLGASHVVAGREAMQFYGACIAKCYPILTYMLGLPLDVAVGEQ